MIAEATIREALALDSAERREQAARRLASANAAVNTQASRQALQHLKEATTQRLAVETGRAG